MVSCIFAEILLQRDLMSTIALVWTPPAVDKVFVVFKR